MLKHHVSRAALAPLLVSVLVAGGFAGLSVASEDGDADKSEPAAENTPSASKETRADRPYHRPVRPMSRRHAARIAAMDARRKALDADSAARRWWNNPEAEYRRQWRENWQEFDRQAAEDRSNRMREWALQRREQMHRFDPGETWGGYPGYGFGGYPWGGYPAYGYGGYPWW